ncbi:NADH-quinone oxidoreductase subunit L [Salipaludibacillus agaradhaerens]|uniref:NADH-quinone oxidoreductase subunit L n=1 Tax=Salipaludibacillus agaradhaerens TaxID=76935 RepID=UPI002150EE5E|nr:NADH-quinone oxidoreductase subunit L [Salipaludibacillus agaradhaerens]MCR6108215.1 NADH-quinone oxidoreductase subunit L [Salipaludibacillus agaradhaerens]MCR6120240.1 NADH-quinone oxidoreductase subunit L [Salipaludibacillus agaradhaerens]
MLQNAWLIPVFPLIAFLILLFAGRLLKEKSPYVGIAALALSFILSVSVLIERIGGETYTYVVNWLTFGDSFVTMGFEVTPLNAMMLIIVTLVSLVVHIFSKEYMHDDSRIHIFYAYLGLFSFSMLGLVLAPNILQLFIFWELVGLCSFLLVGFWYFKPEAAAAAKKAFLTTRIGDVGLLIGLVLLFNETGSFDYSRIYSTIENGLINDTMLTVTALLIFMGAVGKSAQFPLHVWLPDAMEGPTPVSALIHAATMVAAGVYLVAVMYPLFLASPTALTVVAYIGALTAFLAATMAIVKTDIKRVLAYSTISQLGFMMLALGTAGYVAGLFHLMTHAFFKALLFLGAGSVIYAVHHRQDIRHMGGLWHKMRLTSITFLIGALAISGIFPLAGFWSKEEILASTLLNGNGLLFGLALVTAFMTAFYMFRLFFKTFTGEYRGGDHDDSTANDPLVDTYDAADVAEADNPRDDTSQKNVTSSPDVGQEHYEAPKENSPLMTYPLIILALLAVVAGFVNLPVLGHPLENFLTSGLSIGVQPHGELWLAALSLLVALGGIGLAWAIYYKGLIAETFFSQKAPYLHKLLLNNYYLDKIYAVTVIKPVVGLGRFLWEVDKMVIDGLVKLVGYSSFGIGKRLGRGHNGQLQTYGLVSVFGGIVIIAVVFLLRGYIG